MKTKLLLVLLLAFSSSCASDPTFAQARLVTYLVVAPVYREAVNGNQDLSAEQKNLALLVLTIWKARIDLDLLAATQSLSGPSSPSVR